MTKAKKALSLVLAVVMMFGVVSVIAFANDYPGGGQNAAITLEYDKSSYAAGETVTVTAKLTSDYYVAATSIPLQYDAAVVDYVANTTAKGATGLYGSAAATEMVANTMVTSDSKNILDVAFNPLSGQSATAAIYSSAVTLFTAQFTAKSAISSTKAVFGVLSDQKAMSHQAGKLYVGAYETADVTSQVYTTGQVLTFPTIETAPVGTPELVLTDHGTEIGAVISNTLCTGDGFDGCVMGIDTLGVGPEGTMEALIDSLTTEVGSVVINTDASNGIETTGTTIELYDAESNLVATYVFVFFGDLDQDGTITASDGAIASDYENTYEGLDTEYMLLAADVDFDTAVTASDGGILADYENTYDSISSNYETQAVIAATYA